MFVTQYQWSTDEGGCNLRRKYEPGQRIFYY